jgi:hypothetical protein
VRGPGQRWRSSEERQRPDDPEQLYRQLALTNDGPEALWSHQADVLRSWHQEHLADRDVALELPTGAGKTLVGALIGEWSRRAGRERVAYLCLTRQLARQTAKKLSEYGIPNVLLIRQVSSWDAAQRTLYTNARSVAVSVYSHVFNSNPAINDAQLLLLDDAHGAESSVASPWCLGISRDDDAYQDVLSALAPALDPLVTARLRTAQPDGHFLTDVYLASPLGVAAQAAQLEQVLQAAEAMGKISKDARYAWTFLRGHLQSCQIYASYRSLLIRPLIAPTGNHPAFDGPARRIYMSATLGSGGELERSFGRRTIKRIPIPKGWEKQGTGRRLFCFPELTSDLATRPEQLNTWTATIIAKAGRTLVLSRDSRTATKFIKSRLPDDYTVLRTNDVEDDLNVFTSLDKAALVFENRYDGIDLPDKQCRLVVLNGLPAGGDLQERFVYGSMGASEVLAERIRARIMQGSGRATRNARDFAVVLMLGDDLISYVARLDVQDSMHPEIHAELDFGLEQSQRITGAEMLEQMRIFWLHRQEWQNVDLDIVTARDRYQRIDAPSAAELQRSAGFEVAACEAIWHGEWTRALQLIGEVLDALRGGRAPQRYAALWNYLAYTIARRLATTTANPEYDLTATSFYQAARAAARGTTWLSQLAEAPAETAGAPAPTAVDPLDEQAMTGVLANSVSPRQAVCVRSRDPRRPSRSDHHTMQAIRSRPGHPRPTRRRRTQHRRRQPRLCPRRHMDLR